jgi:hypothetical protein
MVGGASAVSAFREPSRSVSRQNTAAATMPTTRLPISHGHSVENPGRPRHNARISRVTEAATTKQARLQEPARNAPLRPPCLHFATVPGPRLWFSARCLIIARW